MTSTNKHWAALGLLCLAHGVGAQDRADMDRTQIIGNRELPKVLYIVPWKKPMPGDLVGRPPVSVLDEAMAPLDRDVFRRQVTYDTQTREKNPTPQSRPNTVPAAAQVAPAVPPQKPAQ